MKKFTIVYQVRVGYNGTLTAYKHITLRKGESISTGAERNEIDTSAITQVFPGHIESIEYDWSKFPNEIGY